MKMELSSGAALKITTLTLAIAAASLSTTAVMAAECQLNDAILLLSQVRPAMLKWLSPAAMPQNLAAPTTPLLSVIWRTLV